MEEVVTPQVTRTYGVVLDAQSSFDARIVKSPWIINKQMLAYLFGMIGSQTFVKNEWKICVKLKLNNLIRFIKCWKSI